MITLSYSNDSGAKLSMNCGCHAASHGYRHQPSHSQQELFLLIEHTDYLITTRIDSGLYHRSASNLNVPVGWQSAVQIQLLILRLSRLSNQELTAQPDASQFSND